MLPGIYRTKGVIMLTAKVFQSGRSQAVRVPANRSYGAMETNTIKPMKINLEVHGEQSLKFGLSPEQWQRVHAVFADYPEIERIVLYGSRAKGTYRPGSDVDLALFGPALNVKIMNKLATRLDDLLLPYEFDLCIFDIDLPHENPSRKIAIFFPSNRLCLL